jgi:glycosyltransferase involved in cell wall biosynthesis
MNGQSRSNHVPRRPKITHVIGSLGVGGAERGLVNLVSRVDPALAEMKIVALIPGGALTEPLRQRGISIETLSMRPGFPDPLAVLRLARHLRQDRPDVVVTWMYHANLIGGLAARLAGDIPVVWNIRHTVLAADRSKRLTRWVARAGGLLSRRIPDRIVFVAHAAWAHHAALGYGRDKSLVIPNGFDLDAFRPDPAARDDVRRELGLAHSTTLVGLIGRFHPDKDHRTFLAAAGRIHRERPDVRFVLCGTGVCASNPRLTAWADAFGVRKVVHFLGCRDDVPRVAAALDLAVCSSRTEAFPQAIGEAMACGLPCVVTDVGDAALLVGANGRVVPPGDEVSLSQACLELLALGEPQRLALGRAARRRIAEHFALDHVLSRHLAVWREACATHKAVTPAHDHERLRAA